MTASNRVDLKVDQGKNAETCNVENLDDGDFSALWSRSERKSRAHHRKSEFTF